MEKDMKFYKVQVDGEVTTLANGELETLQEAVGGYIERLVASPSMDMYVNEEGLLHGLPINVMATALAKRHIVGDVVVAIENDTQTQIK